MGFVPGLSLKSMLGHSDDVDTNLRMLHHGVATKDIETPLKTLIGTPAVVNLSSESTDDVFSTGTGAWVVRVSGLDENLVQTFEDVNLNGQNAVATTTLFYLVETLQVIAAGSGDENAGQIWAGSGALTAGVPANAVASMEAGTNLSKNAVIGVPADKKFVVWQFGIYSGDTTKNLNFEFHQYSAATGLWYEAFDIHGKLDASIPDVRAYPALNEGDVITLRTAVNTGTAKVTANLAGYVVDAA